MDKKIINLLEKQIQYEVYAAFVYKKLSILSAKHGMNGFAKWLNSQYKEELEHSDRIYDYLLDCGIYPKIPTLNNIEVKSQIPSDIPNEALNLETSTFNSIKNIIKVAHDFNDYGTINFLSWFVNEQIEEIKSMSDLVDKFKLVKNNDYLYLDELLGSKK